MSFGRWVLLLESVLGQSNCSNCEVGGGWCAIGCEQLDKTIGLVPCRGEVLGWALQLLGFSGQVYNMVRILTSRWGCELTFLL